MKRLTHAGVQRALDHVMNEVAAAGLLTRRIWDVPVFTQPAALGGYEGLYVEQPGRAMALAGYRARGIYVPLITWSRLLAGLGLGGRHPSSMRDILRHELGHAFAVEHPSLVRRSARFRDAFGGPYDQAGPTATYQPDEHVTEYAATSPAEDFAETFMTYLCVGGDIHRFRERRGVARKLRFVRWLASEVGRRGWEEAL